MRIFILTAFVLIPTIAWSQLPPPPDDSAMAPWAFPWSAGVPGVMSASALIDKPAGRNGPIVARDGHFFASGKRVRFIGVNIAFGGNFPTHDQADAIATRLASFGVNVVRFHHMDNQPYPNGIFADHGLQKLSGEAMDRLDYFISALKEQGVYADLNLHVSREWAKVSKWPNADKLPGYDKQVDVFYPELIAANKQYAKDLLTHVNAYTKNRYADEPAVAMVEINNEDTIFLWGGEQNLAKLPEPYAGTLQKLWNDWLAREYGSTQKLAEAWNAGAEPLSATNLIAGQGTHQWSLEQHESAKATLAGSSEADHGTTRININSTDGTEWHIQFVCSGLHLRKGKFYTVSVSIPTDDKPEKIGISVGMAHEPWGNLGLERTLTVEPKHAAANPFQFGFAATADDDNARIAFQLGDAVDQVALENVSLREGGREGLRKDEDPARGTVDRGGLGGAETAARSRDWYRFLQATDEAYFTGMRDFLKTDVGVKSPITGTIGLGMLGTKSQRDMDFVDAHAYWDHPHFPRRQWDMRDWEIKNLPMVDNPAGATFWGLAGTRVWQKPFTVTEYQHAAPNDWQAECVPMILSYAALQDWDAVFLFDYTGNTNYQKKSIENFFSIEGNVTKMAALPLAARIFLSGQVAPSAGQLIVQPTSQEMLDSASAYFYQQWPFLHDVKRVVWQDALTKRLSVWFTSKPLAPDSLPADSRVAWSAEGPGTGRFLLKDEHGAVFVGFAGMSLPIDLGVAKVKLRSPFAAIQFVPADPAKTLADADRLLLCAVARTSNTGMQWDASGKSVSDQWGGGPARIEVVHGDIEIASTKPIDVWALGPDGERSKQVHATFEKGRTSFAIGSERTVWYELVRR